MKLMPDIMGVMSKSIKEAEEQLEGWKNRNEAAQTAVDAIGQKYADEQKKRTDEQAAKDKELNDKKIAQTIELNNLIDANNVKTITDETERKKAELEHQGDLQKENVMKTIADANLQAAAIKSIDQATQAEKDRLDAEKKDKLEKADAERIKEEKKTNDEILQQTIDDMDFEFSEKTKAIAKYLEEEKKAAEERKKIEKQVTADAMKGIADLMAMQKQADQTKIADDTNAMNDAIASSRNQANAELANLSSSSAQ